MNLLRQLMEMAKSKNKRAREAKRARKNKAENPKTDAQSNLVAKFAQRTGAGFHGNSNKKSMNKAQRIESKKQINKQLDH